MKRRVIEVNTWSDGDGIAVALFSEGGESETSVLERDAAVRLADMLYLLTKARP